MRIPTTLTQIKLNAIPDMSKTTMLTWHFTISDVNTDALKCIIEGNTKKKIPYTGKDYVARLHATLKEIYKEQPDRLFLPEDPMYYFADTIKCLKVYQSITEAIDHLVSMSSTREESNVSQLNGIIRDTRNHLLNTIFFEEFNGYFYLRPLWKRLRPFFNEEKGYNIDNLFTVQDTILDLEKKGRVFRHLDRTNSATPELVGIRDRLYSRLESLLPVRNLTMQGTSKRAES